MDNGWDACFPLRLHPQSVLMCVFLMSANFVTLLTDGLNDSMEKEEAVYEDVHLDVGSGEEEEKGSPFV